MNLFIKTLLLLYLPPILALNIQTDRAPQVPGTWAKIGNADEPFLYQSKSHDGNLLYFGFEAINEQNETFWLQYKRLCQKSVQDDGIITEIVKSIQSFKNEHSWNMLTGIFFPPDEESPFSLGYDKSSFQQYVENIEEKRSSDDLAKILRSLPYVDGGAGGFSPGYQTHVAYIAKRPIDSNQESLPDQNPRKWTYRNFVDLYGDIVISVGVMISEEQIFYKNRGIFRNPLSFFEKENRQLSLPLHSFTAHVCSMIDPNIRYMLVHPMQFMGKILQASFISNQEIFIGADGAILELTSHESQKENTFCFDDSNETTHLIAIEALKKIL